MAKRFIIGVELLTGLAIGAAAAAAAVSFMTALLVKRDLDAGSTRMAAATAFAFASSMEDRAPEDLLEMVRPLVAGGELGAVVLMDSSGNRLAGYGDPDVEDIRPGKTPGWYFAQVPGTGNLVGVKPASSRTSNLYGGLMTGLAVLTLSLALLAFLTPGYLAGNVISPLREILEEADRFTMGGGVNPETAGASFHRLVELLQERERELNEMKERAEKRADRLEKRSAAILKVLGSAVMALDEKGTLMFFNRQSGELFSLDSSDTGKAFPWSRSRAGLNLVPIVESWKKGKASGGEFQLRDDGTGGSRIYNVEISRSSGEETVIMVTDVTRIGELERKLADQEAMADLGAASAGISHEMGNTLCALSGFVDLLARGHNDSRTNKILSEVRREVESAQDLIRSFVTFTHSPEPEESTIDSKKLRQMVEGVCDSFGERCRLKFEGCGEACIQADGKLLESCIRNLVKNAVEADPRSGALITVSCTGGNLFITVEDDGPGLSMDPEEVFRPFRSTKGGKGGGNLGLGLSVSRRIVRAMGGELSGGNRKGGGAVFRIVLPLFEERR